MKNFKDLNDLTNSSAWNKAREVNEIELSYNQGCDVLDYVNNQLDENSDHDEQVACILEAIDEVTNQFN